MLDPDPMGQPSISACYRPHFIIMLPVPGFWKFWSMHRFRSSWSLEMEERSRGYSDEEVGEAGVEGGSVEAKESWFEGLQDFLAASLMSRQCQIT